MKHPSNRELFEYWNTRRGSRPAPERADIEPAAIRHLLADTFILAFAPPAGHPFRVAGTRVCALFGRELKGMAFLDLWAGPNRNSISDVVAVVANESIGVIASLSASSADEVCHDLELLMLPLGNRGRVDARVLGALSLREVPHWLAAGALGQLTVGTLRYLGAEAPASSAGRGVPARPKGRIRHGLVIYDGGLA
jgi:hypothetical protein